MSNQSYEYARLDVLPELATQAKSLIEEAFAYQKNFKFDVDFAPLTTADNAKNRHLIINTATNTVVAHVGVKLKSFVWQGETVPVAMLGGIAVREELRGQGLFQALFQKALDDVRSQCALYILWSDKHELYRRWDFYLAGKQWCYRTSNPLKGISATRYRDISVEDKQRVQTQYRQLINQRYFSPIRDERDWLEIEAITSAHFYLLPQGYAFEGKGMDLQGVIHDAAHTHGVAGLLDDLGNAGVVWNAINEPVDDEIMQDLQQVGLWCPNSHSMALRKLSHLFGREVNFRDGIFVVENNGVPIKLDAESLIDELFNYGKHGLRSDAIPVYIGGLDSI